MPESKDLVYQIIQNEEIDTVPVAPPFQGYWSLGISGISVKESIDKPLAAATAQIDCSKKAGFDAFEASWDWLSPVEMLGSKVSVPVKGEIVTKTRRIIGPESLEKIEHPDPKKDYRAVSAVQAANAIVKKVGKKKFLYSTLCSPFTLVGELRGVEALMLDLVMQPDFASEMLDGASEVITDYIEMFCETGIDGIILADPTASGSLVNKKEFNEFSKPYIQQCLNRIEKEGKIPMVHICGDTTTLLDSIADVGARVFSLDHAVNLRLASRVIDGKMTLLGNLRPFETLYSKDVPGIIEDASTCIDKTDRRNFILGAGCDLLIDTPLAKVMAMKKASKLHREAN
jgi:uroporphyrinogen decarboxylase